jgi:hypothetical protein
MIEAHRTKIICGCLLCFLIFVFSIQMVDGYSQTFTRSLSGTSASYFCKLQAGDRIEASFTLSNLGPYKETWPEEPNNIISYNAYFRVSISFGLKEETGPSMPSRILNFTNTKGDSFSYTASKSGLYMITSDCSSRNGLVDAKDPVLTINYDIIKAETPVPSTPSTPTPSPTIQPTLSSEIQSKSFPSVYIVGLFIVILAIASSVLLLFRRRSKAHFKLKA